MKQISSLDLYFLTKEFKVLENQRIDSFYLEDGIFYLKVYIKSGGNKFLKFNIGKFIFLSKEKSESSHPSSFIAYLRKNLKNSYIKTISQVVGERILQIVIEKKNKASGDLEELNLFLEIFSPGNIILCDKDLIVKNMLFRKKFRDRSIIVKEKYIFPPKKEVTAFNLNFDNLKFLLKKCEDLTVVKCLAIKLGIGGKFAEVICSKSGIDKNTASNLILEEEVNKLLVNFDFVLNSQISAGINISKDKVVLDFFPIDLFAKGLEFKKTETFNLAVEYYFKQFLDSANEDLKEKEIKLVLKKLKNRIKKQEEQKVKIFDNAEKFNEIGSKIYENYSQIDEILESLKKASKELGWEKVLEKVSKSENPNLQIIKIIDYKNNKLILEL